MADPFSWSAIAAYAAVAGAGVSAIGAVQQGNAGAAQADYNTQVTERNITLANQDTQQAQATANLAAQDKARENKRQLAALRASYGTTGLELSGSPLEVLGDTSTEMALDTRRTQYEGTVRGREGALKVLGLQDQQNLDSMTRSSSTAGYMNAGASLLGAGASVAKIGYSSSGFQGSK